MTNQWDHQPDPELVRMQLSKMAHECGFMSLNDMKYSVLGMRAKLAGSTMTEVLRGDKERNIRALTRARSLERKDDSVVGF